MLYVYIDQHSVKALSVTKSLLGQYTVRQATKQFNVQLLKAGKIAHTDIVASAIKEVISHLSAQAGKEKQVFLILPQEAFYFLRSEVPNDITASAIVSFIKEKARVSFPQHLEKTTFDYVFTENENKKIVSLFAIDETTTEAYKETFKLLDIQIASVLPDTLAYYKLFEKTLRRGKIEYILYGLLEESMFKAYIFDSFGLLQKEPFLIKLNQGKGIEEPLKKIGEEYAEKRHKINRLILSGGLSESVRQDTFTKDVGIWTNPLKRILPHFYAEYLKMLVMPDNNPFPILQFDVCFGALIFSIENKKFSPIRNKFDTLQIISQGSVRESNKARLSIKLPVIPKELLLFIASFIGSFLLFTLLTQSPMGFNMRFPSLRLAAKPTPTPTVVPTATPTPTPVVQKEKLKIKVLNGSGSPGKATEVKNILKEKGYQDIVTGNAETFDFTATEVAVKQENEYLSQTLGADLKEYVPLIKASVLEKEDTADIVITIGKDFK